MSLRKAVTVVALAAATTLVTACGVGPDESREDAHDTRNVDKAPPRAIAFNNNYSNVQTKCDGYGHRLFVTTDKALVVLPDPTCPGYVKGQEPVSVAVGVGQPATAK